MITSEDLKAYLGIDYADAMVERNIESAVALAAGYVLGAVGDGVDPNDARLRSVELRVAADFYDNRVLMDEGTSKESRSIRRIVDDICLQLRLENSGGGGL